MIHTGITVLHASSVINEDIEIEQLNKMNKLWRTLWEKTELAAT